MPKESIDAPDPSKSQHSRDLVIREPLTAQPVSAGRPQCDRLDCRESGPPASVLDHVPSRTVAERATHWLLASPTREHLLHQPCIDAGLIGQIPEQPVVSMALLASGIGQVIALATAEVPHF